MDLVVLSQLERCCSGAWHARGTRQQPQTSFGLPPVLHGPRLARSRCDQKTVPRHLDVRPAALP
jgi:hypothetical protein